MTKPGGDYYQSYDKKKKYKGGTERLSNGRFSRIESSLIWK